LPLGNKIVKHQKHWCTLKSMLRFKRQKARRGCGQRSLSGLNQICSLRKRKRFLSSQTSPTRGALSESPLKFSLVHTSNTKSTSWHPNRKRRLNITVFYNHLKIKTRFFAARRPSWPAPGACFYYLVLYSQN